VCPLFQGSLLAKFEAEFASGWQTYAGSTRYAKRGDSAAKDMKCQLLADFVVVVYDQWIRSGAEIPSPLQIATDRRNPQYGHVPLSK
jgi:hypothetical protein